MTQYNFDEIVERKGSGAIKTDVLKERFGADDLIPLWVADMDFRTPDFILKTIEERCKKGILGYPSTPSNYYEEITKWQQKRHHWNIEREWIEFIPGVVKGLALCTMHFTRPGDKIIIQPPVYYPFRTVPENMGRTIVNNPLKEENGFYSMDLEQLESVIDKDCKMLILCNPHNPIGITWDKKTLQALAEICRRHDILVVSDEIHGDMALFGHKHIPFASVSNAAEQNSITLSAPSKTFNMAGIVSSYSIIPNKEIRQSFYHFLQITELSQMHTFAGITCAAAYSQGDNWLQQMLAYVEKNILFVDQYIQKNIPQIKCFIPQASFLVWLDCRRLGLSQPELTSLFVNKAKLALNSGSTFGPGGEGFMRMNVGSSRAVLQKALESLSMALAQTD